MCLRAAGWLSRLSVRVLIPVQVVIPGLWDQAPPRALSRTWDLLKILSLSFYSSPLLVHSLSKKKIIIIINKMSVFCCMELISPVSCFKKKKSRGEGKRSLRALEGGLAKQEKRVFLFCWDGWEGDKRGGILRCLQVGAGFGQAPALLFRTRIQ